ncbi:DUF1330 domain-containing protein [Aliiroseovarius sp. S1339]|uniref:DUF1330 domain-containing protein n=1 Tax=Aliiroseovarius sp. S1339 TaxID=2936990 RepID=UPI0020C0F24F|nr:DUF1330 domain-containing protein [Aliiroseovarius sp. S1339]MCK8464852.1 DUF1330 domain-containing protein [Aliiroseovarius sp. S1339]
MPKGYWIGRVDVSDDAAYQKYIAANAAPFATFGARFLVRGGAFDAREGTSRTRNVVIEFPSLEAAQTCYDSDEYQAAKAFREPAAICDLIIIGGYDG